MMLFGVTIVLWIIAAMDMSEKIKFSIKNEKLKTLIYLGAIICSVIEFILDIKFFLSLI